MEKSKWNKFQGVGGDSLRRGHHTTKSFTAEPARADCLWLCAVREAAGGTRDQDQESDCD